MDTAKKADKKLRADVALNLRGLAPSRERAQSLIMAGVVFSGDRRIDKASDKLSPDDPLEVRGKDHPFVGRGGVKLSHALETFGISCQGKVCADLGASTGGFSDCLLQRGAEKVYAVDVGYGQLAWKIASDPRVVVMDRTHVKDLSPTSFDPAPVLAVLDLSFISLNRVLPLLTNWVLPGTDLVMLVKPQFEVGPENVGKGGIVRESHLQEEAVKGVVATVETLKWRVRGQTESPITGQDGNREFLLWVQAGAD